MGARFSWWRVAGSVAQWHCGTVAGSACQTNEACFGITKSPVTAEAAVITGDKKIIEIRKMHLLFYQKKYFALNINFST